MLEPVVAGSVTLNSQAISNIMRGMKHRIDSGTVPEPPKIDEKVMKRLQTYASI